MPFGAEPMRMRTNLCLANSRCVWIRPAGKAGRRRRAWLTEALACRCHGPAARKAQTLPRSPEKGAITSARPLPRWSASGATPGVSAVLATDAWQRDDGRRPGGAGVDGTVIRDATRVLLADDLKPRPPPDVEPSAST